MLADVWRAVKFNHIATPIDFNAYARRRHKPSGASGVGGVSRVEGRRAALAPRINYGVSPICKKKRGKRHTNGTEYNNPGTREGF